MIINEDGWSNEDEGISLSAPVIMELIEAVHEKGTPFRFKARGHSMTPTIRDGDHITISPLVNLIPGRGDVLAFRHPNQQQLLVHRLLRKKGDLFLIQGDNCASTDGWISLKSILGIVTRVEREGKKCFWPSRSNSLIFFDLYLNFYPFWPPLRRVMAKFWRRLRRVSRSNK